MRSLPTLAIVASTSLTLVCASEEIPNPAFAPRPATAGGETQSTHSWELPALTVHGGAPALHEEEFVGTYGQPRWTTRRAFTEVRTYVIPEGQLEFEYWLFIQEPSRHERDAGARQPSVKQQYEVEMGLGHRVQLDLYQVYVKDPGGNGTNALDATKFELRYAFADWGKVWGNPTVYAEWEQAAEGADSAELKLLLCDSFTEGLHWGSNLVYEAKLDGSQEVSHEFNNAVSWTMRDERLSLGVEAPLAYVTAKEDGESVHHWEVSVGPSARFYPIPHAHVILSEFLGLNNDAPESKTVLIMGWEF